MSTGSWSAPARHRRFSAVPTPFRVRAGQDSYYGSCAWDALGIAAALGRDVEIETTCADCGTPMTVSVTGGAVSGGSSVAHFAVAASAWWEDVVYT